MGWKIGAFTHKFIIIIELNTHFSCDRWDSVSLFCILNFNFHSASGVTERKRYNILENVIGPARWRYHFSNIRHKTKICIVEHVQNGNMHDSSKITAHHGTRINDLLVFSLEYYIRKESNPCMAVYRWRTTGNVNKFRTSQRQSSCIQMARRSPLQHLASALHRSCPCGRGAASCD